MAQVIQHPHEDHDVECFTELADVINRKLSKLDDEPADLSGKSCLSEVVIAAVDSDDPVGAAAFHFHRIESSVAADIEHRLAAQVGIDDLAEALPLYRRIIAQEMQGRSPDSAEIKVVKPWTKLCDPVRNLLARPPRGVHASTSPSRSGSLALLELAGVRGESRCIVRYL